MQITKTNELTPGEYRSHLYFRAVPNETPLGEGESAKDSGISVKIIPVFGISVPMIIRIGENNAQVNLSNGSFYMEKDSTPIVKMTFNRQGNMSVYGDISIDHISEEGKITRVGTVKGLAVYTPNALRNCRIALDRRTGVDFNEGKLRIVYSDQSPKATKLAEDEIVLTNASNASGATASRE